jgi:hypothetical protein
MGGVFKSGIGAKRLLRPLIGVVVAYAVAAQSLLIAVGGFALPVPASDGAPAVELCLHDTQQDARDVPNHPAGNPDHAPCTHCLFCFAGPHHAVIGESAVVFHRVDIVILLAPPPADESSRPSTPAYSIPNPRGPPLVA